MVMVPSQRYECRDCEASALLPEHPQDGPLTIRKGCPECGRIRTHRAVGRVHGRVGI